MVKEWTTEVKRSQEAGSFEVLACLAEEGREKRKKVKLQDGRVLIAMSVLCQHLPGGDYVLEVCRKLAVSMIHCHPGSRGSGQRLST